MLQSRMYIISLLLIVQVNSYATDLTIENIRVVNRADIPNNPISVIFDIKWDNAWSNSKNHDAVWVFMKFGGFWDNHVKLSPDGHRVLQNRSNAPAPTVEISEDSLGFFMYSSEEYRGTMDCKVQIVLDTSSQTINWNKINGLQVFGIEMVYIPEGPFTIGSPDQAAISRASLYQSDEEGEMAGLYRIESEEAIGVGPERGKLFYWSEEEIYNGDQKGPIPREFPKGYNGFYIMKYELTQGQYVNFLNTIPAGWTYNHAPFGGRDYYDKRGGIRLEKKTYVADNPNRPMNFVSFTDGLAFTDWAALRPITELEYEKAARGPGDPIDAEFVWGTSDYDMLERYVGEDAELHLANGWAEGMLTDETRPVFGASYYWVMDLSGSLWEKVITIGNPVGRAFTGSHGDGNLDAFGNASNTDWPKSDNEVGGFGYRGGGYYQIGTAYSDFNPHSPIGYRYYGAWSGGPRSIAYGYRAGRSR